MATDSIRQLSVLQGRIHLYERKLDEKDQEILDLRSRSPVMVTPRSGSCSRGFAVVGAVVVMVTLAAYMLMWKTERKVTPM